MIGSFHGLTAGHGGPSRTCKIVGSVCWADRLDGFGVHPEMAIAVERVGNDQLPVCLPFLGHDPGNVVVKPIQA